MNAAADTPKIKRFWDLANPSIFMRYSAWLMPLMAVLAAGFLVTGLWSAFAAPEDYQQGQTVRIMFIHVPFAWLAMMIYSIMTLSALGTLVWKHPLADVSAKSAAPIGAVFTVLCLATGSLWGKPMWGAWWVWDARLTSVFVLLLIYLGIIALHHTFDNESKAARAAAIVTLVGFVNIPIIKFSVDWWNTLHQPASVFRMDGPTIHASLLWPLLICALGFSFLFFALHLNAMRSEIRERRVLAIHRKAARRGENA